MKRSVPRFILIAAILMLPVSLIAQKKLKLEHADRLSGTTANGERIDKLNGNVVFKQNTTTIYCDSAYFYKSRNTIEAFGKVRITEGDSVTITSNN